MRSVITELIDHHSSAGVEFDDVSVFLQTINHCGPFRVGTQVWLIQGLYVWNRSKLLRTVEPFSKTLSTITFPVGLCFVRGDRAGDGKSSAEQVVASFAYWNADSSKYFDIVFPRMAAPYEHNQVSPTEFSGV